MLMIIINCTWHYYFTGGVIQFDITQTLSIQFTSMEILNDQQTIASTMVYCLFYVYNI